LSRDRPAGAELQRQVAHGYNAIGYPLHALGKTDEALRSFEAARAILAELVRTNPTVSELRQQLAYSEAQIGTLLSDTGRWGRALESYRRARALMASLAQAHPDVAEFRNDLARCDSQIGQVLGIIGEPVAALESSETARRLREELVAAHPDVTVYRSNLAVTLGHIGGLHRKAGRFAESATGFRDAIAVLDVLSARSPEDDYNLACYHSSLAGLAGQPGSDVAKDDGRREADRAMDDLRRAAGRGFRMLPLVLDDHDLDPLRPRPDFRVLIMDMVFPDEPFAR
jgi:tetratricopeptide (TPR) repeat protein